MNNTKSFARHLLGTDAGWGTLALRVPVGIIFAVHGAQKLFGWFGGHGLSGTGTFFESMGFPQGKRQAFTAGLAEAAGGLLIALGLVTPFGGMALLTGWLCLLLAPWRKANP